MQRYPAYALLIFSNSSILHNYTTVALLQSTVLIQSSPVLHALICERVCMCVQFCAILSHVQTSSINTRLLCVTLLSSLPCSPILGTTNCSLSVISRVLYKWNHAVCCLFWEVNMQGLKPLFKSQSFTTGRRAKNS